MKTILIIGGVSSRFWPLTEKPLLPILGRTLIEHQVERLHAAGCNDIILVVNERNAGVMKSLFPMCEVIVQTRPALGMREAFLDALPLCKDEPVLLTHGNDAVLPAAYRSVCERLERGDCDGAILAREVMEYFPGGYLTVEGERATGIMEKPGAGNEPSHLVNIVVHAHRSAALLLRALEEAVTTEEDGYEHALAALFRNRRFVTVPYNDFWQAVKYPWHALRILDHFLGTIKGTSIAPSAVIHKSAVIEGPVIVEEGVRVLPHATIVGPAYIGPGSVIGNNALIRNSSIGASCVAGFATEVARCLWHDRVWTHSSYTGDSVIGENVALGAGCVTGNLRLDEKEISSIVGKEKQATGLRKFGTIIGGGVRIGAHTTINPGMKIGGGSFVAGGNVVAEDIPEKSFVVWKGGEMVVRKNTLQVSSQQSSDALSTPPVDS